MSQISAVIPLLLLFVPAILTAVAVVREKELGSITNFYVTPVTRLEYLLGKQLPYVAIAMVSFVMLVALAFAFGLLGLFGNPLLLFIALFVYLAATSEASAVQMREVARGIRTGDAMITHFESLSPASRVHDAIECLIKTTQHEFPVVDGAGRLRGVLTRTEMIKALRESGPDTPVIDVRVDMDDRSVARLRDVLDAYKARQPYYLDCIREPRNAKAEEEAFPA